MKNKKLSIRISDADWQRFHEKAEQANMTLTEYITDCCLGKQIVVIDGLDEVIRQQKAIGRNLNQLAQLQSQQENICEYLEKGVYTIDMFTKRNATLAKEIKQLQSAESDLLRQQGEGKQKNQATSQIIPTTQHILDNYDTLTIAEKNRLWELVMPRATVYRSQDDKLMVSIYPNLPK